MGLIRLGHKIKQTSQELKSLISINSNILPLEQ